MCRMFFAAASPARRLPAKVFGFARSFGKLAGRGNTLNGKGHRDGWGYIGYTISPENQSGVIGYKERSLKPADSDPAYNYVVKKSRKDSTRIILTHLRNRIIGDISSEDNLQPFVFNEWCGCHNGVIDDYKKIPLLNKLKGQLKGNTDSEVFLLYLVSTIRKGEGQPVLRVLAQKIREIKAVSRWLSLSFILTDGETAITYVDYNNSRDFEHLGRSLADHFTLYRNFGPDYVAVCSEPLGKAGKWQRLPAGFLSLIDLNNLEIVKSQGV